MQRTRLIPLFLLATLLAPLSAEAAKWVALSTRGQAKIEIDPGSMYAPGEGRMRLWHRENYATPRFSDSGEFSFSRLTMLTEFNCEQRLSITIQQTYAKADGTDLKTESPDSRDLKPVIPDSNLEAVFAYACKKKPKPVVVVETPPPPVHEPVVESKESQKKSKNGKKGQEEPPPPPPPPPHWTYTGNTGTEKWGSLAKDFAVCSQGQRQSPIDIRNTVKADLPPIKFTYKAVPLSIIDNGHTIKVDTPDAGGITVEGESYDLIQFHFHKPSEEKINGKSYGMVAHLVHQSKEGKLAVVAVLMEPGKEQSLIRTLWTNLPLEQEKPLVRSAVKLIQRCSCRQNSTTSHLSDHSPLHRALKACCGWF